MERKGSDMASFHHHLKSGKKGTAAGHARYIAREGTFSDRADLIASGHGNMPDWASGNPLAFWRAGDKYERSNGAVFREHEIALPMELTVAQQLELAASLIDGLVGKQPFQYAVHAPVSSLEGCVNTHLHLMYSSRLPDGIARSPEQTFRRHNPKEPALGGAKKDSGGRSPLELRDELIKLRRKCASLQNEALAKYGHSARVDHRTLEEQGVSKKAERHLGPARVRRMDAVAREAYVVRRGL
jgi:hypothetical protein